MNPAPPVTITVFKPVLWISYYGVKLTQAWVFSQLCVGHIRGTQGGVKTYDGVIPLSGIFLILQSISLLKMSSRGTKDDGLTAGSSDSHLDQ